MTGWSPGSPFDRGLDSERIRQALVLGYPRAADMPPAGFAAGPCLFKDTLQLATYNNSFALGHTALGMAFKGGSDDTRSSLSYRLKHMLEFKAGGVACSDPYVTTDPHLRPLGEVLSEADLLIIGAPHPEYRDLATDKPVADIWNVLGKGIRV